VRVGWASVSIIASIEQPACALARHRSLANQDQHRNRQWEVEEAKVLKTDRMAIAAISLRPFTELRIQKGDSTIADRPHAYGFGAKSWAILHNRPRSTLGLTSLQTLPVARLTTPEFFSSALEPHPAIAVFDCDGTLWGGDAGYGFMVWSLETGLVSRNASDWIDSRYRLYRTGEVSEAEMCGEMVQVYAGLREDELRKATAEYFHTLIEPQIFPELRELVTRLRAANTEIWAVSSTNNWLIEEGVRDFGIPPERVIATEVRVIDGLITSELINIPTGEGKAESLIRAGVTSPDAVFGNSVHDAAMLALAKRAFPVNASPALLQIAADKGWPVFYPQSELG
jgi:phosphoserine phosphatase